MVFNFLGVCFVFFVMAACMGEFNNMAALATRLTPAILIKSLRFSNTSLGVMSEGVISFLGFIVEARLEITRLAYLACNRFQNRP
jgi:hypothetical protein